MVREGRHGGRMTWLTLTFRTTQNDHWCHAQFSKEVASVLQKMGEDSVHRPADALQAFCAAADSVGGHEPDSQ